MSDELHDRRRKDFFMVDNVVILEFYKLIGGNPFAVYCYLIKLAGDSNKAYPSYSTMAKVLGISRRSGVRAIDVLIKHGLITKETRADEAGDQTSNMYYINDLSHLIPNVQGGDTSAPPSDMHAPGVVTPAHQGGALVSPKEDPFTNTQNESYSNKEDIMLIQDFVISLAREFGDEAPAASLRSQVKRLYLESSLSVDEFVDRAYDARQRTRLYQGKQGNGAILSKPAYFLTTLRHLLSA